MLKFEFESIAGYEVTNKDYYTIIEPMYMASSLDKYEFVKCLNKKRFACKSKAKLLKEIKLCGEQINTQFDIPTLNEFEYNKVSAKLDSLVEEYKERFDSGAYLNKGWYVYELYGSDNEVVVDFVLYNPYWEVK